ncbi:Putative HTH-type transcriptional regulator GalR [Paraburkholderia tropica]|uniref:LysR family transcriptional regulator n=1 Tax=Paraburkholderia TaxID=1822464 RepID=UPI001CAAEB36|nr:MULTISPECIES: LysR family transcriptional regulator [Paraburkholderia]CAG9222627.1 Putative HTH-type transcriptional regulator GalR [Paraburkholderia tropica]
METFSLSESGIMASVVASPIEQIEAAVEQPSLWQLRVFEAVARHENVTQASQELLRSQPATTSCLAAFESLMGVSLFERSTTGTWLAPAGVAALVRTRKILQAAQDAVSEVGSTRNVAAAVLVGGITRTQMRCLIAIAECGSFRAAARLLSITEASLQRAARTLEQNLGAPLYRHSASGVTTTEAGKTFARQLKTISNLIAAMTDALHAYQFPRELSVTVGVLLLDPSILIVSAIRELSAQFPDARVVVINGTYDQLLTKLLRGEIDFMLGVLKQPDASFDFVESPLYHERYCVVARRDHPLARETVVTADALRNYQWIVPPRSSPRREAYEYVFSDGATPFASIETYSLSTIRITLFDSDMLTVLSWTEVLSERRFGLLAPLMIDVPWDGPVVGITARRDWQPNDVQETFLRSVRRNALAMTGGQGEPPFSER